MLVCTPDTYALLSPVPLFFADNNFISLIMKRVTSDGFKRVIRKRRRESDYEFEDDS